jgi:hypothetical protein
MKIFSGVMLGILLCLSQHQLLAQCPAGYTAASVNWDALDYLPTSAYSNAIANAASPNQYFAFGKNRLNITYTGCTSPGENGTHTGETGSYGVGEDVQYTGNGTITLTFTDEVANLKFSLYDIDKSQTVQLSAGNTANVQQNITVTTLGTSILTVSGTATNPVVTASNTVVNEASVTASFNVDIAGPVKTITLAVSNTGTANGATPEDGSYWLSDISACSPSAAFPASYYQVSRPFTGQPAYVLESINNSVYYVDPATGNAKLLFTDGATSSIITSMGYDPFNHVVYYVYGLVNNGASAASADRSLHKYDLNTGVATTLVNDINTLGIPTFSQGVENGGACFYDGAWYIGIEGGTDRSGGNPHSTTGFESIIWRLDFNSSGVPATATQVFGVNGDTNDWGDFVINDGTLYNFNADPAAPGYNHFNLQTGVNQAVPYVGTVPSQCGVGWDGSIYWLDSAIAKYNLDGTIGTKKNITSTPAIPNWSSYGKPLFTDGGGAFRPPFDFGDAPASYDPDPLAPAMHELSGNLKLGAASDWEWDKTSSVNANADGSDEDGLPYVKIFSSGTNYQTDLRVYNNTGANATVCAWVDFNGNGVFDPSEGISQTVASSTSTQDISLFWNSPPSNLANNSYTYLRVRITSASNGMTTANPTGYFNNGEVEDYYVVVSNTPLDVKLTQFAATKVSEQKVALQWKVGDEQAGTLYEVQRSSDGSNWQTVHQRSAATNASSASYTYVDEAPFKPISYYRLKYTGAANKVQYSQAERLQFTLGQAVNLYPNPVNDVLFIGLGLSQSDKFEIKLRDLQGRRVHSETRLINAGSGPIKVDMKSLQPQVYILQVVNSKGEIIATSNVLKL